MDFDSIMADIGSIRKEVKTSEVAMKKVLKTSKKGDVEPFKTIMEEFFAKAASTLQSTEDSANSCKQKFTALVDFFQIKPKGNEKSVSPKDFFDLWSALLASSKSCGNRSRRRH